jgi:NAD(P)-dependent dehydrogenase (short-subunit alcohol dehydrogenase family)
VSRLTKKNALVTGGSRGIGAAIALRLAQEGANVALTYESSFQKASDIVRQIEALGRRGLAISADSQDPAAIKAAVERTAADMGGLDILVNNAGIFRAGPVDTWSLKDIDAMFAINVRAVIIASQTAAAYMTEGGRIISTGSCLAERVVDPNVTLYAMSKAALIGFTKGLARDLGARGITVNLVHPGPTDTDMNPATGTFSDTLRSRMAIPRYGQPGDIASLVAWLASEEGRYVTGAGFAIDGGTNI